MSSAVQPLAVDLHRRTGSSWGVPVLATTARRHCSWNLTVLSLATFLRCLKHRIWSSHSSGSMRPECRLRVLRRDLEAPVEHRGDGTCSSTRLAGSIGGRTSQAKFRDQPILKAFPPFMLQDLTLGPGRLGENHLYPRSSSMATAER